MTRRGRLIWDRARRLGNFDIAEVAYDTTLRKEEVAREFVFGRPGSGLTFLDVGARDGRLEYLLGIRQNLEFDEAMYREASYRDKIGAYYGRT
jgi:hypothetical protein